MKTNITLNIRMVFGLIIVLSGCGEKQLPMADESGATSEGVQTVVNANNQFAFDLYLKYINASGHQEKNVFFSPYSIYSALAVTYEGAKGQTSAEIQNVFHFPVVHTIRRPAFAKIYNEINKNALSSAVDDSESQKCVLSTANALWAHENFPLLVEYISISEKYYGSNAVNLDFINDAEDSRSIINNWIEKRTRGKIKDIVPESAINSDTRLLVTNTIYFKGEWENKFEKDATYEDTFYIKPNQIVKTDMMHMTNIAFNYAGTKQWQVLELPYYGGELSMLIILPRSNDIQSLEHSLTIDSLNRWKAMLQKKEIKLSLPKFKIEDVYFLEKPLTEMGMPLAFTGKADLSGITEKPEFYISDVIHKAFVEVNENGTEASAATVVYLWESIDDEVVPIFTANRPFIFFILQRETGNIIFMGKLTDPSQ